MGYLSNCSNSGGTPLAGHWIQALLDPPAERPGYSKAEKEAGYEEDQNPLLSQLD
jgi:hypothetical protein